MRKNAQPPEVDDLDGNSGEAENQVVSKGTKTQRAARGGAAGAGGTWKEVVKLFDGAGCREGKLQRCAWSPEGLQVGRFLCHMFYRDLEGLREAGRVAGPSGEVVLRAFEAAVKEHPPWGELLSGTYRPAMQGGLSTSPSRLRGGVGPGGGESGRREVHAGQRPGAAKLRGLGGVVWHDMDSIDGVGKVRAGEVWLYAFVAYEFLRGLGLGE